MDTNPPPERVPGPFQDTGELERYFRYLHDFLRLLWDRTGGAEDNVNDALETAQSAETTANAADATANTALSTANSAQSDATDALNSVSALETLIQGCILPWAGSIASIPSGWQLADGTNGTDDLRNLFIIGADADSGGTYNVDDSGGSLTTSGPTGTKPVTDDGNFPTTVANTTHTHTYEPPYFAKAFIQYVGP